MMPLGHRVLIKPDEVEKVTAGGIHIPEKTAELAEFTQTLGTVIAIGEDAFKAFRKVDDNGKEVNGTPWVKVGDHVMYAKNAGWKIKHPETEEKFILVNDDDLKIGLKQIEVENG